MVSFGIPEALERQPIFLEKLPPAFCKDRSLPIVNLCADLFSEARTSRALRASIEGNGNFSMSSAEILQGMRTCIL